ncbi:hypothetical protein VXM60_13675 [Shewanella khirikhana]|uniref:hypothetical protein n=1 Tax=Shewanella khirikhana TaxID=1965282 RepID=UPI0030CC2163
MSGEQLILYVLVPCIVFISIGFVLATFVLIKNNLAKSERFEKKQERIIGLSEGIDLKVNKMHDTISNQLAPTINYIKTGVEELTFKPSIEKIKSILDDMELAYEEVNESGSALAFGVQFEGHDVSVGFILHFYRDADLVHLTSFSNRLITSTISQKILTYLMQVNSQMVMGNIYLDEIEHSYPIVASYSFKANKSNFSEDVFNEVVMRLASTHKDVTESLLALGVESENIDMEEYLTLQNAKIANKSKQADS